MKIFLLLIPLITILVLYYVYRDVAVASMGAFIGLILALMAWLKIESKV